MTIISLVILGVIVWLWLLSRIVRSLRDDVKQQADTRQAFGDLCATLDSSLTDELMTMNGRIQAIDSASRARLKALELRATQADMTRKRVAAAVAAHQEVQA